MSLSSIKDHKGIKIRRLLLIFWRKYKECLMLQGATQGGLGRVQAE